MFYFTTTFSSPSRSLSAPSLARAARRTESVSQSPGKSAPRGAAAGRGISFCHFRARMSQAMGV